MSKTRRVNKTRIGSDEEILQIVEETRGKTMTMKEAIKRGLVKIENKKTLQKLFSEEELKEMGYDYTEEEESKDNKSDKK